MPGELRVQGERMTYRSSKTELPPPPPLQPPQYSMQILPPEIQDQLNTLVCFFFLSLTSNRSDGVEI